MINAIEAIHQLKLGQDENILILLANNISVNNITQMKEIAKSIDWHKTHVLQWNVQGYLNLLRSGMKLAAIARQHSAFDNIMLGHYSKPLFTFANAANYNQLHMLDDGLKTVLDHRALLQSSSARMDTATSKVKRMLMKAVSSRIDFASPEFFIFFTAFCLETGPAFSVEQNTYSWLKSLRQGVDQKEEVYFLGKHTVEIGKHRFEDYANVLKKIKQHYNLPLVYLPHRRESPEKLDVLAKRLQIEIRPQHLPIELVLAQSQHIPRYVVGFTSTALITLSIIFAEEIQVHKIEAFDDLGITPNEVDHYVRDQLTQEQIVRL
jgi:hypothetical protein